MTDREINECLVEHLPFTEQERRHRDFMFANYIENWQAVVEKLHDNVRYLEIVIYPNHALCQIRTRVPDEIVVLSGQQDTIGQAVCRAAVDYLKREVGK